MTRLWDVRHSYYCNESNYFASKADGGPFEYPSWAAYVEEFADADLDYNLVFRWDWKLDQTDDGQDIPGTDTLYVFNVHQRKGRFCTHVIRVSRADEPAIRAWLQPRLDHLLGLWAPLDRAEGT